MRKTLTAVLVLCVAMGAFAADKSMKKVKRVPAVGPSYAGAVNAAAVGKNAQAAARVGPGLVLMETTYDFMTNNSMGRHVHNYGDGSISVVRTGSEGAIGTWPDRGSFFSFRDIGANFSLPLSKVETNRVGWGNLSALTTGENVIVAHGGLQVNVDALKGFGIWTSNITGNFPTGSDPTWPRIVADGADVLHIVVTHSTFVPFTDVGSQIPVYGRSTDKGITWEFRFLFQPPGAAPGDRPDTTNGLWIGGGDADAYSIAAFGNKVGVAAFASYDAGFNSNEIMFAESSDNGATWTFTNVTNIGKGAPPEDGDFRPNGHLDLAYDVEGQPHIVFENFLVLPDSAGAPSSFSYTLSPLRHWSPSTGISQVATRNDIPGGLVNVLPGSENWGRGLGTGLYYPSLGVGQNNVLYVIFSAPTPGDVDADTVNYLDIYATASANGGRTWGSPVANVTNSPGTEDKYGSLARLVDDSLRIVYGSDEVNGGIIQPGNQTTGTTTLFLSFPASAVPTTNTAVNDRPTGIPAEYALNQNYPNPFNPSTEISFSLPAAEKVSLRIFNVSGQEVATLVNGKLSAGIHKMKWNAEGMPSGVYFYRLVTGSFSEVKKMILLQ